MSGHAKKASHPTSTAGQFGKALKKHFNFRQDNLHEHGGVPGQFVRSVESAINPFFWANMAIDSRRKARWTRELLRMKDMTPLAEPSKRIFDLAVKDLEKAN